MQSSPLYVAGIVFITTLINALYTWVLSEKSRDRDRKIAHGDKLLDRESAERSQQLDLYKVVYPEKVKAATLLMNRSGTLYMEVRVHFIGAQSNGRAAEIESELNELFFQAKSFEPLLGNAVVPAVDEFRMTCLKAFVFPHDMRSIPALNDNVWAHDPCFQNLATVLRETIHLDRLDGLLSKNVQDTSLKDKASS